MYVRSPIYRKIRDVIQSCKINAVAAFLGGMLRNVEPLQPVCIIEPRVSVELRGRVTVILLERSARELDYK